MFVRAPLMSYIIFASSTLSASLPNHHIPFHAALIVTMSTCTEECIKASIGTLEGVCCNSRGCLEILHTNLTTMLAEHQTNNLTRNTKDVLYTASTLQDKG